MAWQPITALPPATRNRAGKAIWGGNRRTRTQERMSKAATLLSPASTRGLHFSKRILVVIFVCGIQISQLLEVDGKIARKEPR